MTILINKQDKKSKLGSICMNLWEWKVADDLWFCYHYYFDENEAGHAPCDPLIGPDRSHGRILAFDWPRLRIFILLALTGSIWSSRGAWQIMVLMLIFILQHAVKVSNVTDRQPQNFYFWQFLVRGQRGEQLPQGPESRVEGLQWQSVFSRPWK